MARVPVELDYLPEARAGCDMGGGSACRPHCGRASAGLAKNEDCVDINDINERKRQAKKEREAASGLDGSQTRTTAAASGASNCVDVNADGLMYVQLDFSGRTTRNVTFRTLPRTDYAEVNFKASTPPPLED